MCDGMTQKDKELTEKHNALLVCDEIQCGVGRTGAYFAYQLASPAIIPDVAVTAKPLGNGIPIGVIMTGPRATPAISPGMHGTTFGGGALPCRTPLERIDLIAAFLPNIHQSA